MKSSLLKSKTSKEYRRNRKNDAKCDRLAKVLELKLCNLLEFEIETKIALMESNTNQIFLRKEKRQTSRKFFENFLKTKVVIILFRSTNHFKFTDHTGRLSPQFSY